MFRKFTGYVARQAWLRKAIMSTPFVRDLAWRFVAGEDLDAGLEAVRKINAKGILGTLNYVGTHVKIETDARAATDEAIRALIRIHEENLSAHLSLKLTQIGLDISEELCRQHLQRVLEVAHRLGNFVRIDMEESRYVDRTLKLFEGMLASFGPETVGIVIQSYLHNRPDDLDRVLDLGARVRLVKGGYWEQPDVVYRKKADIDLAFVRGLETLLRRATYPAIASHDAVCLAHAKEFAMQIGLPRESFEFQMLFGVRPDLQEELVREGYIVRCYVPYGRQWYQYFLGCARRIPESLLHWFQGPVRPSPRQLVQSRTEDSP
jgi:proline dehydrogenase